MNGVRDATLEMFKRYKRINSEFNKLCAPPKNDIEALIDKGIAEAYSLPIDKLSRWLGYVQGYLILNRVASVETERDIPKLDYILSKYKEFSTEGLPDFATGALNGAIAQFAEKHNNFKDVFKK